MTILERELRVQLAACYRIFDYLDWTELIYNHITTRVPGEDEHFLINPYGLHYSEVTASNLVKVDVEGNIIGDSSYNVNPAGMVIHTAVHAARSDARCVAHIHTEASMAIACSQEGLRYDTINSALLYNNVAYHDFEGVTVNPEEKPRLVSNLGKNNFMILRNHGLLTCGETVPEMFLNMYLLQRACEMQVAVDSTGRPIVDISEDCIKRSTGVLSAMSKRAFGELEFNAFVRKIDAIDPSYCD